MKVVVAPRRGMTLAALLAGRGFALHSDCGGAGTCGKCRVRVLDNTGERWALACQFVPPGPVIATVPALHDRPRLARAARPVARALRMAVDVGTTTVSLAAVDLKRCRVVRHRDELNPQTAFGADVMTRVSSAARVRTAGLGDVLTRFVAESGINPARTVTAVGNTVMAHFLLGKDPSGLGEYPYRSHLPLKRSLKGRNGGLRFNMLPLLGSFVGSDCTAAILASGLHRSRALTLLVDAGTNGEVVLGNGERLLVCSTAAGPAFEGATLECGSLAVRGAVKAVELRRGRFRVKTVGGGEPESICGSGVLDAVAAAVEAGLVADSGRVLAGTRFVLREGEPLVYLSQADVREVQLAKGAIAAAIRILLAEWGAGVSDIARVYLTGKFGAALNPAAAVRIGLLPRLRVPVRQHGNMALAGAVRAALDRKLVREAEAIARSSVEVMLADHPRFEEEFVLGMRLAPWR
jgi:uncharacterized 2Fe-2S/4Fe-4S cluster protein (DUF4445 family)